MRLPRTALAAVAILGVTCLRLVCLEADTPPGVGTGSFGVYVDEGYKSLDARNLALFGRVKWNPHDEFAGLWTKFSPGLQGLYYAAFELAGVRVGSIRLVTIVFFGCFLSGYLFGTERPERDPSFSLGLLLLGLAYDLFVFSRVALHPIPIITSCYWLLFLLKRKPDLRGPRAFLLAALFTIAASVLIKPSALFYFAPVIAGMILHEWLREGWKPWMWLVVAMTALAAAGFLVVVAREASPLPPLQSFSWRDTPRTLLIHPLAESASVLLVAAGLLSAGHALSTRPRSFLKDRYRLSLVLLITVCPLLASIVQYRPLRYFVPILPAYVLLTVEWFRLRSWTGPSEETPPKIATLPGLAMIVWGTLLAVRFVGGVLLAGPAWQEFRRDHGPLFPVLLASSVLVILGLWLGRRRLLVGRPMLALISLLLAVSVARDLRGEIDFFSRPSFRSREISAEIVRLLPDDASVAGDWAPFLLLNTKLEVLRMSRYSNFPFPDRLSVLRPEYFLFSDTTGGVKARDWLKDNPSVEVGPQLFDSEYAGRAVILYPLSYRNGTSEGAR